MFVFNAAIFLIWDNWLLSAKNHVMISEHGKQSVKGLHVYYCSTMQHQTFIVSVVSDH